MNALHQHNRKSQSCTFISFYTCPDCLISFVSDLVYNQTQMAGDKFQQSDMPKMNIVFCFFRRYVCLYYNTNIILQLAFYTQKVSWLIFFFFLWTTRSTTSVWTLGFSKKKKKGVWTLVYLVKIKETEAEDFKDLQPLNDLDNQSTTWV